MAEQGPLEDEEAELSELECLVLDTTHIITCLYKFSIAIQNPAPQEKIDKIALIDVSHFEDWDIMHIDEKFHSVDARKNFRVAKYLIEGLGKANAKRRQLLKYYEAHPPKVSQYIDGPLPLKALKKNMIWKDLVLETLKIYPILKGLLLSTSCQCHKPQFRTSILNQV